MSSFPRASSATSFIFSRRDFISSSCFWASDWEQETQRVKKYTRIKNDLTTHGGRTTDSTDLHCTILLALSHFSSLYCFFKGDLCFSQTYHSVSIKLLQFSVLLYQRCPVFLPLLCQANKSLCTGINHTLSDKNKVCEMRVLKPPLVRSAKNSTKIFEEKKAMPQNIRINRLLPW